MGRRNQTGIRQVGATTHGKKMERGVFIQLTNRILHTPLQSIWKRLKETKEKRSKCGMKASPLKVDRRRTLGGQMIALRRGLERMVEQLRDDKVPTSQKRHC